MTGQTKRTMIVCMCFWFCLCVYKTYGEKVPQIKVNDWTHCDVSDNAFRTLWGLSIKTCLLECDKRRRCKALNVMRGVLKCDLLETDVHVNIDVDNQRCIHISQVDNIGIHQLPSQCTECPAGLVCDLSTGSCLTEECEKLNVSHGTVVGNINSVGSTVITIPETGYSLGEQSPRSVCLSNGTWDDIPVPQIVDCGQPLNLTHASLTDDNTVYGTTTSYVCDSGYDVTPSSASTSITCGSDGEWSQPDIFQCTVSDPCYAEWQLMEQTRIHYRAVLCKKDYQDATDYCLGLGPDVHLAYVKTSLEYQLVKQYLTDNLDTNLFHSWWIGISMGITGWVYTGTQTPIAFKAWSGGQGSGDRDHCVELTFKLSGKWNDARCHVGKYPICERRLVP